MGEVNELLTSSIDVVMGEIQALRAIESVEVCLWV
jgi:hypothetical protein